jgi:glycosyltransferase involved in cell wall biosynthesis
MDEGLEGPDPRDLAPGPGPTPLVAVIVPTRDRAAMLGRAIRSALGQTMPDVQVVVVDDASTDDTPAVLRGIQDPRLRHLRLQQSGGPARARNAGIRASQSEWVAFLDDDDEWLPDRLALQAADLERREPAVGVLHCLARGPDGGPLRSGWPGGDRHGRLSPHAAFACLARDWTPGPSRVIVRRAALLAVGGFDERVTYGEDVDLWLRLAEAGYVFAGVRAVGVRMQRHDQPRRTTEPIGRRRGTEILVRRWAPVFAQRFGRATERRWRARVCSAVTLAELSAALARGEPARAWRRWTTLVASLPWSWPFLLRGGVLLVGGRPLYRAMARLRSAAGRRSYAGRPPR